MAYCRISGKLLGNSVSDLAGPRIEPGNPAIEAEALTTKLYNQCLYVKLIQQTLFYRLLLSAL